MITRRILFAATLLLMIAGGASFAAAQEEDGDKETPRSVEWLTYRQALNKGRDEKKPVLIHFTADWCKWCEKMKKETYTDPAVIRYMAEHMSVTMVDTEDVPSLARKYNVSSLPTLWFLDAEGQPLTAVPGYLGPEKLLRIMEYISTKAYETVSYDKWRRHQDKN